MWKNVTIIITILMCIQTTSAQDKLHPIIKFTETIHDFDTISQGENCICIMRFENIGTAPLIISDVSSSCGCTTPSYNEKPVLPQTTGSIVIKYDTSFLGEFKKYIKVTSNAANKTVVVLTIKGYVKRKE